jgi:ABC-2 type transport system permease protein
MFAIIEREMRKFFRSPTLMIMSLMMPILQLVIMGNAFGGKITGARVAVVDYDHGPEAVKLREAFDSIAVNIKTFTTINYTDENMAREDVRTGKIDAAVVIPAQYSRRVYAQDAPHLGLVVDNSDQFMSGSLEAEMQLVVSALTTPQRRPGSAVPSGGCRAPPPPTPVIQPRLASQLALEIVELYPYVNYMKFLLPLTVALAMYISVMIGGGMLYIDDKARGVHEGYLVTPITRLELVFGMNIAGSIKAVLAGISLTVIGSLMAGLGVIFHPEADLELLALIIVTSVAFNGMMFLMMVRVDDPLVPRAMFGVLNTLLLYPSGGMYPIAAFPRWLRAISIIDPFTYCVHGFKAILLKDGGFVAIQYDLLFLFVFGMGTLLIATPLFKRTL